LEEPEKSEFTLTSDDHRFIETMGLHFEDEGIPRIGGRMIGLLMLADRPLSLGQIAELLKVSPASVSTNARLFHTRALVEEISIPGDRRHYYVFSQSPWEQQIQAALKSLFNARNIYRSKLTQLSPDEHVRRQRMSEACEFFDFFHGVIQSALEQWRARRQQATEPTPNTTSQSRTAS
jgi:DNA-binding transcriptional regulator GbsR (MarR family)